MKTWLCLLILTAPATGWGQSQSSAVWAAEFYNHYNTRPDIAYKTVGRSELKLDLYQRADAPGPVPTVIFVHGGAWAVDSKSSVLGDIMPWLEMGWTVVNVDYRLSGVARAPAAVEDCMCALRWVGNNAKKYRFDLDRLVISGASAGGELALMMGMAPPDSGLDRDCPGGPLPRPAAMVDVAGVVDMVDLIDGPPRRSKTAALAWLPEPPEREEIARQISPITYVRPGLPPILTIQGDADPQVPYEQAVRFHAALTKAGVPNRLLTIPGGKHGGFSPEEHIRIYQAVRAFLAQHHLEAPGWEADAAVTGAGVRG